MAAKVIDFGYGYQPFHVAFYEATNGDDYPLRQAMPDITFIESVSSLEHWSVPIDTATHVRINDSGLFISACQTYRALVTVTEGNRYPVGHYHGTRQCIELIHNNSLGMLRNRVNQAPLRKRRHH